VQTITRRIATWTTTVLLTIRLTCTTTTTRGATR
jgi:hypothetical protein